MRLKLYDYECSECGVFERLVEGYIRRVECDCGRIAHKIISAPRIHDLNNHMKGTDLLDSHGGYFDHNLRDRKTGKAPYITSLEQKKRILKERGFYEVGPTDVSRDKERGKRKRVTIH